MKHGTQMSESLTVGALLAVVGGFLDAYTYLLRGGVFANAQTGNVVLLGLSLAELHFGRALYYLVPITAFALGVLVAELFRRWFAAHPLLHWRQVTLAVELLILFGVSFLPQGRGDVAVNVLISFICAMQVESFRKLGGDAYATTMCTGNLRSGTELLFLFGVDRDRRDLRRGLAYYAVILCFVLGALLGGVAVRLWAHRSVLVCCGLLAVCFALLFRTPNVRDEL